MGSHVHARRLDAPAALDVRPADGPRTGTDHDLGCADATARAATALAKDT